MKVSDSLSLVLHGLHGVLYGLACLAIVLISKYGWGAFWVKFNGWAWPVLTLEMGIALLALCVGIWIAYRRLKSLKNQIAGKKEELNSARVEWQLPQTSL